MKILLSIMCVFFCSMLLGQDYKKGYLVDNSGNRIECLIKKEDWAFHPDRIVYKLDESAPEIIENDELSFAEIGIYDDVSYKRFTVDIERSASQARLLTTEREPKWNKETQLLRVLVAGTANLYYLTDMSITKYFYDTPSVGIVQLLRYSFLMRTYSSVNTELEGVYELNRYRDQLRESLQCDSMTANDFNNLPYKKNALVKIFNKYNECEARN